MDHQGGNKSAAEDNYAEDNYAEDNYAEDNYAEDNYAEDNYAEDNYAEDNYAEDNYAEDNYAEDNYAEEQEKETLVSAGMGLKLRIPSNLILKQASQALACLADVEKELTLSYPDKKTPIAQTFCMLCKKYIFKIHPRTLASHSFILQLISDLLYHVGVFFSCVTPPTWRQGTEPLSGGREKQITLARRQQL